LPRDDPALVDLPHPVRVDGAFDQWMEEALFGADFWLAQRPYLVDETLSTEWVLNHAPGVYELACKLSNFPATVNFGLLNSKRINCHFSWGNSLATDGRGNKRPFTVRTPAEFDHRLSPLPR
jgi:hypothetical protein